MSYLVCRCQCWVAGKHFELYNSRRWQARRFSRLHQRRRFVEGRGLCNNHRFCRPSFTDSGFGGLVGSTLVLNVYTPKALNCIQTSVGICAKSVNNEAQKLCGIWSGAWSGKCHAGWAQINTPVNGTWILNLQTVDWLHQTASGTLTWIGTDAYYSYDSLGYLMPSGPRPFIPNRTFIFNSSNATLTPRDNICSREFYLHITGWRVPVGHCGDADYGPDFHLVFSSFDGSIVWPSNWFTQPYDPITLHCGGPSCGELSGSKSQQQRSVGNTDSFHPLPRSIAVGRRDAMSDMSRGKDNNVKEAPNRFVGLQVSKCFAI